MEMKKKDTLLTIEFIKTISGRLYGKEIFFYDETDQQWYSRVHGDYVTYETVLEWLEENISYD